MQSLEIPQIQKKVPYGTCFAHLFLLGETEDVVATCWALACSLAGRLTQISVFRALLHL